MSGSTRPEAGRPGPAEQSPVGRPPAEPPPADRAGPAGLDLPALRARLAGPLGGRAAGLTARLIDGGRSNLTYLLTDGERRWVLRRPPLGHVLATAHDMSREYRVLSALARAGLPVPRTLLSETDASVIGAPFFVMEYVPGPVIRTAADARALPPADAARAAGDLVDQLVALHRVDPAAVGLADLGRPDGFLARQIRRWQRQWDDSGGAATGLPLAELAGALRDRLPRSPAAAVVHGDYRLDNTILAAADPGRVAAIVDWEMATLGDPLADLGLLLTYWDPVSAPVTGTEHAVSANPGFPGAAAVLARYADGSGRDVSGIAWYGAFGRFKLAVIAQTIQARYARGLTVGARFDSAAGAIPVLIDQGRDLLGR
jgi:aminoglycoside phosphotransferase (APT) family kinase protein